MIPGLGRFPGKEKGYPLQCSGLENSMDCTWGRKESDISEQLSLSLDSTATDIIYMPPPRNVRGFPGGSDGKESVCNVRDLGSIPGLGRSPGGGHGNRLQYSCLENSMDRGAWWATVHGVTKSQTRLSD